MISLKKNQKNAIDVTGRLICIKERILALTEEQMKTFRFAAAGHEFVVPLAHRMQGYAKKAPRNPDYAYTGPVTVLRNGAPSNIRVRSDSVNVLTSLGALRIESKTSNTHCLSVADVEVIEFNK